MSLIHGSRARVVRNSLDGYIRAQGANNSSHHTDGNFSLLEDRTLLNVKLEISGDASIRSPHGGELLKIASDKTDALPNRLTALGSFIEQLFIQTRTDGAAANMPIFLVLKDDDLKGVAQFDPALFHARRHL